MKALTRFFKYSFFALSVVLASCASDPNAGKPDAHTVMPQEYPKTAAESYQKLASHIPADSDILAISGYGTLADAVVQAKNWAIVDGDEFQKLLNDLGTHYLLNPADLKTYFKAGFNVESGFAMGIKQKTPYFVFDVSDHTQFRKWVDNFLNEEFGRPRYHEMTEGTRKVVQIRILDRDFATLVEETGKPVIMTFGPGLASDAPPSLDAYHAFAEDKHMADLGASHEKFIADLRDAPLAMWIKSDASPSQSVPLPKDLLELYPLSSGAGFALHFASSGPKIRAFCTWRERQYKDMSLGQWISELTRGSSNNWAKTILNSKPSSMMRILLNPEQLEPVVLPTLKDKHQKMYADLKDKLTQRFLKLNISEQVIYNTGAAWAVLYEANATAMQNATWLEMLSSQDAAVFIPMKDAAASDSFFAKVNILKGFVPKDLGTVELEGDMLHAKLNLKDGVTAHVVYSRGLIAVATDKGWPHVQEVFTASNVPANDSLFALDTHFFAMNLKMSDITTILGTRFGIIREQIGVFLKPFERIEAHASANATSLEVVVEAPLAKTLPQTP